MKRNLPIVFKYLAIVAVSCLLAVGISHRLAAAQEPEPSTRFAIAGASSGVYMVETSRVRRDGLKARDAPVKLYYPAIDVTVAAPTKFPVTVFSHGLGRWHICLLERNAYAGRKCQSLAGAGRLQGDNR